VVRVVMKEQVRPGEWNEMSVKENCKDDVDEMKQKVYCVGIRYSSLSVCLSGA